MRALRMATRRVLVLVAMLALAVRTTAGAQTTTVPGERPPPVTVVGGPTGVAPEPIDDGVLSTPSTVPAPTLPLAPGSVGDDPLTAAPAAGGRTNAGTGSTGLTVPAPGAAETTASAGAARSAPAAPAVAVPGTGTDARTGRPTDSTAGVDVTGTDGPAAKTLPGPSPATRAPARSTVATGIVTALAAVATLTAAGLGVRTLRRHDARRQETSAT